MSILTSRGRNARKFARVYFSTQRYVQGYRRVLSLALDSVLSN